MRKVVSLLIVCSVVLGAFTATDALAGKKKKKPRSVSAEYGGPAVGYPGFGGLCFPGSAVGCVQFAITSKERYMSLEITDDDGLPVPAWVTQDYDDNGEVDNDYVVCGTTEESLVVEPGVQVVVYIYATPAPGCAGAATSGTMEAKFFSKPFKP